MIHDLVKPNDWMATVDLKDAYFLIPIHSDHQHYLRFQWEGQTYQFHCLPFGLSCAPQVFKKVMKPVVAFLREKSVRLIIYLDDIRRGQGDVKRSVKPAQGAVPSPGLGDQLGDIPVQPDTGDHFPGVSDIHQNDDRVSEK